MRSLRLRFAVPGSLVLVVALAGCSGGAGATPTATLTDTFGPGVGAPMIVASDAEERSLAQTALTTVFTTQELATFRPGGVAAAALARGVQGLRAVADVACTNGFTETTTIPTASTTLETLTYFYDAGCTNPRAVVAITAATSGAPTGETMTLYDGSGAVRGYERLQFPPPAPANGFSATISQATSPQATPFATGGFGCTIVSSQSQCTSAIQTTAPAVDATAGDDATENATISQQNGTITIGVTVTDSVVLAAGTAVTLTNPAVTQWTLVGGTSTMTDTLTGSFTVDTTSQVTSGTTASSDSRTGLTIATATTRTGTTGKLTQLPSLTGSFAVDADGDGTITYTDGTTGTISGYHILP